jgi:hypothetical protein
MVDGEILTKEFRPTRLDLDEVGAAARTAAAELAGRAGI